jgi:hypothetical protein
MPFHQNDISTLFPTSLSAFAGCATNFFYFNCEQSVLQSFTVASPVELDSLWCNAFASNGNDAFFCGKRNYNKYKLKQHLLVGMDSPIGSRNKMISSRKSVGAHASSRSKLRH